ncbi:ABC transporter substrate-binding protein [Gorillibacterium timonense]|uniref:ABC transporter substrate-binding protein n=1 Tax=Gorillibacterium timonense TaxID=1689269 RepID=UPI000AD8411E|nr:extracellular solute-binding protein [Gorillibacterium timonense]
MRRKKGAIAFVSMVVGMSLLVTACGGSKSSESADPKSTGTSGSADSAKLSIMWWGSQERHDATVQALDLYTKNNAGVTFSPQYTDWDGYWKKLPTLAASKSMPDVFQMDAAYIQEYVSRGLLEDLSAIDLGGAIDEKVIEKSKIDGKLYGVPLSYNGTGFVYNKPELEAAGMTLPKKDWTWDEFFAFAEEGRAKLPKGKYAIGDYTSVWNWYQDYQMAYGKGPVFQDGTKLNIDKDLWFTFQKKYEDFRARDIIPSASVSAATVENDPKADPLLSGLTMTRGVAVGAVSALEKMMPGKLEVVNNPVGPNGGGWAQSTMYWVVSKDSEHKAAAEKFLKWIVSDTEAGKVLKTTRGIPISGVIFDSIKSDLSTGELLGIEMYNMAADKAMPFAPAPPGWSDFVKTYSDTMTEVMFKKKTLDQAFDTIMKKGEEVQAKLSK